MTNLLFLDHVNYSILSWKWHSWSGPETNSEVRFQFPRHRTTSSAASWWTTGVREIFRWVWVGTWKMCKVRTKNGGKCTSKNIYLLLFILNMLFFFSRNGNTFHLAHFWRKISEPQFRHGSSPSLRWNHFSNPITTRIRNHSHIWCMMILSPLTFPSRSPSSVSCERCVCAHVGKLPLFLTKILTLRVE